MQKYHSQSIWQKISKITAWLLLVTLAANFLNILVAPQKAHAVGQVRYPTGDISAAGTWAVFPTSPTTKWDKVDEVGTNDGDTSYLTHGTSAGSALFSFSAFSIPAGSTINSLTVTVVARDVTAGTNKVQPAIRVNGTNYLTTSTSTEVQTSYWALNYTYATNPNTKAAWTVADINGTGAAPLQGFGASSADANPAFRITQVYATVYYTSMSVSTDKGSYPTSGETISVTGTVNVTVGNVTASVIDYVIFIDTNADNMPTAGETYVTANCAGSGAWATNSYTFQTTGVPTVYSSAPYIDNKSCANTNFPSNTTYTIWSQWDDGGATIYATAYATFTSVPTLGEILFLVLVGCAVFIGVKSGVIKLKLTKPEPEDKKPPKDIPPELPHLRQGYGGQANNNHQGPTSGTESIDGVRNIPKKEL